MDTNNPTSNVNPSDGMAAANPAPATPAGATTNPDPVMPVTDPAAQPAANPVATPVEPASNDTEMSDADMQAALENMSNDELLDLFAEQMMVDKGLRDEVDEDVFAVLKDDLKDRLAMQINRAILVQLPDDKLEQLDRDLNSDAASVEGFEKMVTEAGVDIAKTTQDVMEAFRNTYLGLPVEE